MPCQLKPPQHINNNQHFYFETRICSQRPGPMSFFICCLCRFVVVSSRFFLFYFFSFTLGYCRILKYRWQRSNCRVACIIQDTSLQISCHSLLTEYTASQLLLCKMWGSLQDTEIQDTSRPGKATAEEPCQLATSQSHAYNRRALHESRPRLSFVGFIIYLFIYFIYLVEASTECIPLSAAMVVHSLIFAVIRSLLNTDYNLRINM